MSLSRLPAPGSSKRLSKQQSVLYRQQALKILRQCADGAEELINSLRALEQAQHPVVKDVLIKRRVEVLCLRIHATLAVECQDGPPPGMQLEQDLAEVSEFLSPALVPRIGNKLLSYLLSLAATLNRLLKRPAEADQHDKTRASLVDGETDLGLRTMVSLMGRRGADVHAEVSRLSSLAPDAGRFPLFSQGRIRKLSLLLDRLPKMFTAAATADPLDESLCRAVVECFHLWHFGQVAAPPKCNVIQVVSAWDGVGCALWEKNGRMASTALNLDVELVRSVLVSTEIRAVVGGPVRRAVKMLTSQLAPMLEEVEMVAEVRIEAMGHPALLPVLGTASNSGSAMGQSEKVAYLHPRYGAQGTHATRRAPADLLILDQCFGRNSKMVREAFVGARAEGERPRTVVDFDSRNSGSNVLGEVEAALLKSSSAIFFGHGYSSPTSASHSGLILGRDVVWTVERQQKLDLRKIEDLAIVACSSGRHNPFVGPASVSHAFAMAGARQILYTMWPILATTGAKFLKRLLEASASGKTMAEVLADDFVASRESALSFGIMRP
jgi:hypothetical protein